VRKLNCFVRSEGGTYVNIRTSSIDPEIVLADDGLRILRLVRFAAELQFKIDPATFACASRLCGNLRDISAERIRDELNKLLLCDIKYGSRNTEQVLNGLLLLRDAVRLQSFFPSCPADAALRKSPHITAMTCLTMHFIPLRNPNPCLFPALPGCCTMLQNPLFWKKTAICTDTMRKVKLFPEK